MSIWLNLLRENIKVDDFLNYTNREMQAITIAKSIKNGQIAIVGTGLPLIGASLAKRIFAPDCYLIVESGMMDCAPLEVPRSVGDNRLMGHCSVQWPNFRYVGFQANEWLHGSDRIIAFIGGAQIDPFGNVNSTCIGDYLQPKVRFTGSGGANGIATFINTVIMMQHEKRRFIERTDYLTSVGWGGGGPNGRSELGLSADIGPQMVVTDRGIMKFDERSKRMYLAGFYETSSPEEIIENTGFEIDVSRAVKLDPPLSEVIRIIREEIDPKQVFIKWKK
jgi:glutaconate CoA-transferase subunit B